MLTVERSLLALQEYDESNEFVIADTEETEEAARNKEIIEKLEASIAAQAAAALNAPRGKGRARSAGSKRGYVLCKLC